MFDVRNRESIEPFQVANRHEDGERSAEFVKSTESGRNRIRNSLEGVSRTGVG